MTNLDLEGLKGTCAPKLCSSTPLLMNVTKSCIGWGRV